MKTYLSDDGLNSRDLFFKVLEPMSCVIDKNGYYT